MFLSAEPFTVVAVAETMSLGASERERMSQRLLFKLDGKKGVVGWSSDSRKQWGSRKEWMIFRFCVLAMFGRSRSHDKMRGPRRP